MDSNYSLNLSQGSIEEISEFILKELCLMHEIADILLHGNFNVAIQAVINVFYCNQILRSNLLWTFWYY